MSYDLGGSLLTVFGVLAGIGTLLYVMTVLDPTNVRAVKQLPTPAAQWPRRHLTSRMAVSGLRRPRSRR